MKLRATHIAGLTVAAVLLAAGTALAANAEQSGTNTTCADNNAGYLVDRVVVAEATGNVVDVDPETGFQVSSDASGPIYVDFYNAAGFWIGWNDGASSGTVPAGADFGSVCVGVLGAYPEAPNPAATWTYQDGF